MTTTRKTTRHDRGCSDPNQLRLFAEVEAVLTATTDLFAAPGPLAPAVGPAREQNGRTCEVLALAFLDGRANLEQARLAFGRDEDTKARSWSALEAVRSADASVERTRKQLRVAVQCGDAATVARCLVVGRMLLAAAAANRARLNDLSELHRLCARGGPAWGEYLDTLTRQQDVIDRADDRAQTARGALLSRLAADRPAWLPVLAVDATQALRDRWNQQALEIASYRARYGVTGDNHPLGQRPVDLDQAAEYDRTAVRLRLAGPVPIHGHDRSRSPERA